MAAADLGRGTLTDVRMVAGSAMNPAAPGAHESIWLNEWAWRDLGVPIGAPIDVDYYHWEERRGLVATRTHASPGRRRGHRWRRGRDARARRARHHRREERADVGPAVSAGPSPHPPGRTRRTGSGYRGTPKAFVTLAGGQALWQSRFGRLTAVRVALPEPTLAESLAAPDRSRDRRLHRRRGPARRARLRRAARSTWARTSSTSASS